MAERVTDVGFIGLGDQGGPMATAIAEAGFTLHVWARRAASLRVLADVPHVVHDTLADLGTACQVVGICVSTDEDVQSVLDGGLLAKLRPGSVVVNHGTGVPSFAAHLTGKCAEVGVDVLDAPVSGAHAAAVARTSTTMVGGDEAVAERCAPIFEAWSSQVRYMGPTGSGQLAKLFNNALMMMNQANIEEVVAVADGLVMDVPALVELLKVGSATSFTLSALNDAITVDNAGHLREVELLDMKLFAAAMAERDVDAEAVTGRGVSGAEGLVDLITRVNPR
ncbi:MAG TPA: NAD(P)-dependent oxidoreductase [Pseudonocardiaceae bacterium]|nr:NAD(P)-dependent oxidoreductase [Pseudonocardiaceae bacterium]